jgi:hypothetical protein
MAWRHRCAIAHVQHTTRRAVPTMSRSFALPRPATTKVSSAPQPISAAVATYDSTHHTRYRNRHHHRHAPQPSPSAMTTRPHRRHRRRHRHHRHLARTHTHTAAAARRPLSRRHRRTRAARRPPATAARAHNRTPSPRAHVHAVAAPPSARPRMREAAAAHAHAASDRYVRRSPLYTHTTVSSTTSARAYKSREVSRAGGACAADSQCYTPRWADESALRSWPVRVRQRRCACRRWARTRRDHCHGAAPAPRVEVRADGAVHRRGGGARAGAVGACGGVIWAWSGAARLRCVACVGSGVEAVQAATVAVAAATTPVCAWRGSCGRMSGRAEYVGWWVGRGAARRSARCTARGTVAAGSGGGGSDAVAWCRRRVAACRG